MFTILNSGDNNPRAARILPSDRCIRCLWKTAPRETRTPGGDKFETIVGPHHPIHTPTRRFRRAIENIRGRLCGGV